MKHTLNKLLFTGPTKEQDAKIERQTQVEVEYMKWVHSNPGASLEEAQKKYEEINIKSRI